MTDIIQPVESVPPTPTAEEIARHYEVMGHSVDLINALLAKAPDYMTEQERTNTIKRNVEHLQIMLAKDFWTDEDMTAVKSAIAAGK